MDRWVRLLTTGAPTLATDGIATLTIPSITSSLVGTMGVGGGGGGGGGGRMVETKAPR